MQYFFAAAILLLVGWFLTNLFRPTRRRDAQYDDLTDYTSEEDFDFQQRSFGSYQGYYQQPFQQPLPPSQYPYNPNLYQQQPYYPQQPYQPLYPPPYPPYRRAMQNNWMGIGSVFFSGVATVVIVFLAFIYLYSPGKQTSQPATGPGQEAPQWGRNLLPLLKQDQYVLHLRECRDDQEATALLRELSQELNDHRISLLKMGATTDLCIWAKSRGDAQMLESMWNTYRAQESMMYKMEPRVINLRDWCDRLAVSPDHSEIICGEK